MPSWEPIVKDRGAQKRTKHRELAADLANQWPGYTVQNAPVVIGTQGLVVGMRKAILGTGLWNEKEASVNPRLADKRIKCCSKDY